MVDEGAGNTFFIVIGSQNYDLSTLAAFIQLEMNAKSTTPITYTVTANVDQQKLTIAGTAPFDLQFSGASEDIAMGLR